jgi:ribonuclease BN (tRNA processing enzyme)
VRIRVLGAHGGASPRHRQTSFLLNEAVCLDAGAVAEALSLAEQARVRAVLLTHAHLDHVASLPFLLDNVFGQRESPIEVAAPAEVIASLRRHLFNDELWPDFSNLSGSRVPGLVFRVLPWEELAAVAGLSVRPVPVSHVVPACGYLVSDGGGTVIFSGDTGPTERLWAAARAAADVRAVFVECSFPDERRETAALSRHLTPETVRGELAKMPPGVPVFLYHMKPSGLEAIAADVAALGEARLRLLSDGDEITL